MYQTHFGLRQRPFRATPDSACYYPATGHEQALQRLLRAVADGEGPVVLTGAPGTGKTLLCHCLLERLGPDVTSAFLTQGHFGGRTGLLQAILFDLSVPHEGRGEQELRLTLTDLLLRNYADGRKAVVIVDEAHHLSADLLEELRLLGNLEARQGKAVQVVLAAQPSLMVALGRPELASLSQRLAVRASVESLSVPEAAHYLIHHVRAAGGQPTEVFDDEALEMLAGGTRGVPRLLNQAAHEALTLACSAGVRPVDAEAALEALALLGLEVPEGEARRGGEEEMPAAA
jgi:type II secretory pathway predicted ATPase ExeA